MTITTGERLPDVTLFTNTADGPGPVTTSEIFSGRKVVLFAVPGAFTPGCSNTHMPGFVVNADKLLDKVDTVACVAVNDAFVMGAWQKDQNAEAITMLADGNADFTRAIGMDKDASAGGMGVRSLRYAMIVNDGIVEYLGVDTERGVIEASSADTVMSRL
ncbi:peroxiredoxin [Halomonas cupida]|uniref:Glutathione-dependent peroxiredoxin n=1 Tax=Halomonas cupida TaxID=44933 RepID=A0A1M7CCC1_9GAMM|nr:peroxiredoxin [Halomonas cupida]GEN25118.1 peroxiredoxin [Halomonas cupida]SHL64861.1 peroxiredoxin [Halomonas cupida]